MIDGMKFGCGGVARICEQCSTPFLQYRAADSNSQRFCPSCQDIRQERPSVVVRREQLAFLPGVEIKSLPSGAWELFQAEPGDEPRYRLNVAGARFGAAWRGRIVIWAKELPQIGDIVAIRHMRSTHEVAAVYTDKVRSDFRSGQNVAYRKREVVPLQEQATVSAEREVESHEYVAIEPWAGPGRGLFLEWVEAYSKITLKGLGAQFANRLKGNPLWKLEIHGSVRSGRAFTTAWLAITDSAHPVVVVDEDAESLRTSVLANLEVSRV